MLVLKENKGYINYPQIGYGQEGSVHKYNDDICYKTFIFFKDKDKLPRKFEKIERLSFEHIEGVSLPIGLVRYEDSEKVVGYYSRLVKNNKRYDTFEMLQIKSSNTEEKMELYKFLLKADSILKSIHSHNIVVGDVKTNNIMVDRNGNPVFIDTDNYRIDDYDFDLTPSRASWLKTDYGNENLFDNDKYLLSIIAIQNLMFYQPSFLVRNKEYMRKFLELIDTDEEIKEGIRNIFSDSEDKPYISDVIKDLDVTKPILSKKNREYLKWI